MQGRVWVQEGSLRVHTSQEQATKGGRECHAGDTLSYGKSSNYKRELRRAVAEG